MTAINVELGFRNHELGLFEPKYVMDDYLVEDCISLDNIALNLAKENLIEFMEENNLSMKITRLELVNYSNPNEPDYGLETEEELYSVDYIRKIEKIING